MTVPFSDDSEADVVRIAEQFVRDGSGYGTWEHELAAALVAARDRLAQAEDDGAKLAEAAGVFARWPERFIALEEIDKVPDAATVMMDVTAGDVKSLRDALAEWDKQ